MVYGSFCTVISLLWSDSTMQRYSKMTLGDSLLAGLSLATLCNLVKQT